MHTISTWPAYLLILNLKLLFVYFWLDKENKKNNSGVVGWHFGAWSWGQEGVVYEEQTIISLFGNNWKLFCLVFFLSFGMESRGAEWYYRNIHLLKYQLKCSKDMLSSYRISWKNLSSIYSIIKIGQYSYRKQYNKIEIFGHY